MKAAEFTLKRPRAAMEKIQVNARPAAGGALKGRAWW